MVRRGELANAAMATSYAHSKRVGAASASSLGVYKDCVEAAAPAGIVFFLGETPFAEDFVSSKGELSAVDTALAEDFVPAEAVFFGEVTPG